MLLLSTLPLLIAVANAAATTSAAPLKGAVRLALNAAPATTIVTQACGDGATGHTVDSVSFLLKSGVKMTTGTCSLLNATLPAQLRKRVAESPLPASKEPGDECDTPCRTVCFKGRRSPDPADCQVIFDALADGQTQNFLLGQDGYVLYTFKSCGTSFTNQIRGSDEPQPLTYCYRDWAAAGHYIAGLCQAEDGAAGGKCVAAFGSFIDWPDWYMQVYNT